MPQTYDYLIAPKASFDATADAIRAKTGSQAAITWGQDGFADAIGAMGYWSADDVGSLTYPNNLNVVYTKTSIGVAAFLGSNITSFYAPSCTTVDTAKTGTTLGGSEMVIFQKCSNLTTIDMPVLTATKDIFAPYCTSLTNVNLPLVTYVGAQSFQGCTALPGYVGQKVWICYTSSFQGCTNLKYLDILGGNTATGFRPTVFSGDTKFDTLIIRSASAVQKLENTNVFTNTPFASGGTGGTLYVPNSMISSYQAATNWTTILGYANNQIKSIESTHTDPNAPIDLTLYYADGTPIPTT